MIKKTAILMIIVITLVTHTACSQRLTADDIAFRLLNLYPYLPACSQFVKNGTPYESGYLSQEDFGYLYTGERTKLPEWGMIEEFRLVLSDTTDFFEIHVIRVKTASDTDEIAKLLRRRAELLVLHNKIEEDYIAKEPLIYISGYFAILVATDDNESARRMLKKIL